MTAFLIYLISTVDSLINVLNPLSIIFGILYILSIIFKMIAQFHVDEYNSEENVAFLKLFTNFARISKYSILMILLVIFTPNSKTIAAMYLVPKIIENKQVSELPEKMVKLLNVKMDDWINDLVGENNDKSGDKL